MTASAFCNEVVLLYHILEKKQVWEAGKVGKGIQMSATLRKFLRIAAVLAVIWLGIKYLLPLLLPFIMGTVLALAAEPLVGFVNKKCRFPRGLAAGLGVSATLLLFIGILSMLGALAVKELGNLAGAVPQVADTVQSGMGLMQDWLVSLMARMPESVGSYMTGQVLNFFDGGRLLLDQVLQRVPGVVTSVLGWLPDGLLGIGTGIIAAFMISARLPKIKNALARRLPESWQTKYLPMLRRVRSAVTGWLKAQGKLAAVTWALVSLGFLLLQIPYGPLWALLVALVDAVPLLGTGTVLLPWALVEMLQGNYFMAIGLTVLYAATAVTRAVLEPRLVGRQLGLDPLVTLLALYTGYQLWGILGMVAAPMLATVAKTVAELPPAEET